MKIELSNKQVAVIMTALEAFQRARMGQFVIAFEEIFPQKCRDKTWEEMTDIEVQLKNFFFGKKNQQKPSRNPSWGICNKEKIGEDAQIAYEIYCTLRQFTSLEKSGGLFGMGTNFDSPLKLTDEPLPVIDGHKELTYKIHEFPDQVAAKKLFAAKDADALFDMVEKMNLPYGYCASKEIVWVDGEFPETKKLAVKINQPHKKFDNPQF